MIDINDRKLICKYEMIRLKDSLEIKEFCTKYAVKKEQIIPQKRAFNAGDIALISFPDCFAHIVMPGETIQTIAKKYNVLPSYIINNNKCKRIFIGQILFI